MKPTYQEQLESLIKRALKAKDAQKALYYSQNLDGSACAPFEQFKNSWDYSFWEKNNKKSISALENNYHFKYW
jgi:hypothetical protein